MRIKPKNPPSPKVYCPHCKVEITSALIEFYTLELKYLARKAQSVVRAAAELMQDETHGAKGKGKGFNKPSGKTG